MAVSLRRGVRFAPLAAPVVLAVVLAACGGDDGDGRVDVTIGPTSFQTRPPVTTAAPIGTLAPGETLADDARNPATQQYEIQRNDNLSRIASLFDIDMDDIVSINEWSDGPNHNLFPGDTIVIPPDALDASVVERQRASGSDSSNDNSDETGNENTQDSIGNLDTGTSGPECDDGSDRPVYEVQSGDYQGRVAGQLDIELTQLAEVNASNPAWNRFAVGDEIWLPCEDELDSRSTEG